MSRYLLFAGANYYPSGGWDDFVASFDTLEAATEAATAHGRTGFQGRRTYDWFQVVDTETWTVEVQS